MLVTDLSRDVAGRFCTRLLALGGADVVSYPGPRAVRGDTQPDEPLVAQQLTPRDGRRSIG